jgi:hypothetical protein
MIDVDDYIIDFTPLEAKVFLFIYVVYFIAVGYYIHPLLTLVGFMYVISGLCFM